jgi:hypothetical protein
LILSKSFLSPDRCVECSSTAATTEVMIPNNEMMTDEYADIGNQERYGFTDADLCTYHANPMVNRDVGPSTVNAYESTSI